MDIGRGGQTIGHAGRDLFVASLVAPLLVRLSLSCSSYPCSAHFSRVLAAPRRIRVISGGLVIALHKIPL